MLPIDSVLVTRTDWVEENLERLIELYERQSEKDLHNLERVEKWRSDSRKTYFPHAWLTRMRHDTFARNLWQENDSHQEILGLTNSNYQNHSIAKKFLGIK